MENESQLIQAFRTKDSKALSILYDNYSGAIFGLIIRMCHDREMAENLLQDTFVKAWENASSYDPEKGRFYTWLYRIAKNITLNALRKDRNLIQNDDLSVYENRGEENKLDFTELNGSIQKLEAHHKRAIDLVYFKGYTHKEAHEIMKVPLGTFKSYVRQALKQLRENYEME